METTLHSMLCELNSFVACAQHFEVAAQSGIKVSNNKNFAGLVKEWGRGDYDECPELLLQRLLNLLR
jgi:hypothetical protein